MVATKGVCLIMPVQSRLFQLLLPLCPCGGPFVSSTIIYSTRGAPGLVGLLMTALLGSARGMRTGSDSGCRFGEGVGTRNDSRGGEGLSEGCVLKAVGDSREGMVARVRASVREHNRVGRILERV